MENPPTPLHRPEEDDAFVSLDPPIWVKIAAAFAALAGVFAMMLGAQLTLSNAWGGATVLDVAIIVYFVAGIGTIVAATMVARGRTVAAVVCLVACLALALVAWVPFFYGVLALTSLGISACAAPAVILLGISIPACLKIDRAQRQLLAD